MIQSRDTNRNWWIYASVGVALLVAAVVVALWTRLWIATAFPIGFLFGFSLHRGDLCTAAACSEVVLFGDARKMLGFWVAIVVSMLGFALLDLLGWVALAPMDAFWANNLLGGVAFGIGMTLAGGCVSGCLYKSAAGNVNSMAGLVGIPLGAYVAQSGPLLPARDWLAERFLLASDDDAPLTFYSATGRSYATLAILFALGTAAALLIIARRKKRRAAAPDRGRLVQRALTRPWKPWQAGLVIGLLAPLAYLSSAACGRNYPLGVATGVIQTETLLIHRDLFPVYKVDQWQQPDAMQAWATGRVVELWELVLVFSVFAGAWVSGRLAGARLLPKPPEQIVVAFFGGILMGLGVGIGFGCNIGHVLSGWALMSVGSLIFGLAMILANWATTYLYLR